MLVLATFPAALAASALAFAAAMPLLRDGGYVAPAYRPVSIMPVGPWTGLGLAFAWALATLAPGYLLLRARDA